MQTFEAQTHDKTTRGAFYIEIGKQVGRTVGKSVRKVSRGWGVQKTKKKM